MVKVSILTVCLNAGRTIDATIRSVLSQDYENTQYIIIDCLSTDNTMEVVNSYSERISVIISEKDNGIYDAINKGITLAEGDIVGLINADDVFANSDVSNWGCCLFERRR
jgi:glycosyltransferase involved in cell wall biosynthesis